MHTHDLAEWRHDHRFDSGNMAGERSTLIVMWITAGMMVVEIGAGWFYNSMALLADGFHMSSHAVAIGLSAFAYAAARRHAGTPRTRAMPSGPGRSRCSAALPVRSSCSAWWR